MIGPASSWCTGDVETRGFHEGLPRRLLPWARFRAHHEPMVRPRLEPVRAVRRFIFQFTRDEKARPAKSDTDPGYASVDEAGRSRAAFITAVAEFERGQEYSLVHHVDFSDDRALVHLIDGTRSSWELHTNPTSQHIVQGLAAKTALAVHDPVPDHPAAIRDVSPDPHVTWVSLLHDLGNFYASALLEDSPRCRVDRIERFANIAQVSGHAGSEPSLVFEVPLDGTYDVHAVAFDIGFGLRAGRNTLLYW